MGNWDGVSVTYTFGSGSCFVNKALKLCLFTFNAGSSTTASGRATLPSTIVAKATVWGALRDGGYIASNISNSYITIEGSAAWRVGFIIFPIN